MDPLEICAMKFPEAFLQWVWLHQVFNSEDLKTTDGRIIRVERRGNGIADLDLIFRVPGCGLGTNWPLVLWRFMFGVRSGLSMGMRKMRPTIR
jgi:hypothetical protein